VALQRPTPSSDKLVDYRAKAIGQGVGERRDSKDLLQPDPGLGPLLRVLQVHPDTVPQFVAHRLRDLDRKGLREQSPSTFDEVVELTSRQRTVPHWSRRYGLRNGSVGEYCGYATAHNRGQPSQ
jgi:hypothetical protein